MVGDTDVLCAITLLKVLSVCLRHYLVEGIVGVVILYPLLLLWEKP
jgi:hypothetical protein